MTGPGAIAGLVMAAAMCALLACYGRPGPSPSAHVPMTVTTITNRANHKHSLLYTLRGELAIAWSTSHGTPGYAVLDPQPPGAYADLVLGYSGTRYVTTDDGLWIAHPDGTTQAVLAFDTTAAEAPGERREIRSDLTEPGYRYAMADYAATRTWWKPGMKMTGSDPLTAGYGAPDYYDCVRSLAAPDNPRPQPATVAFARGISVTFTGAPEDYAAEPAAEFRTPSGRPHDEPWTLPDTAQAALTAYATDPCVVAGILTKRPLD